MKGKLLIIDDEVEFTSTVSERLKIRGINVTDANSGTEGLAKLKEVVPDVVVLDLKMPDMDGIDVLVKIKEYDPTIEVIMLTGHGSGPAGIAAMEKGALDYVMKPVDLHELLEKINAAYEKRCNS